MAKVFLSWSGPRSRRMASELREWLPNVLHDVEPWMSAEDINKGARWAIELSEQLEACDFGIICVTSKNVNNAWLNFEAGALAKHLDRSSVVPVLLDVPIDELRGPLSQFQAIACVEEDVLGLLRSLNQTSTKPLDEQRLKNTFSRWWEDFLRIVNNARLFTDAGDYELSNHDLLRMTMEYLRNIALYVESPGMDLKLASDLMHRELITRLDKIGKRYEPSASVLSLMLNGPIVAKPFQIEVGPEDVSEAMLDEMRRELESIGVRAELYRHAPGDDFGARVFRSQQEVRRAAESSASAATDSGTEPS